MAEIHLVCNAHLDPVWQWDWEEGAAAAVSTFRAAADFCEEFDDFVFCHNEALLYKWVEEYEPALFSRIQKLVKAGKWHITGGWYLQPDCNMPCGESIIRQIKLGREYFQEKFGTYPETAVSFDAFGHNRGLVQILNKAGFRGYLYMRPYGSTMKLPANDFVWVGYDGSGINAHHLDTGYNSPLGGAADKIKNYLEKHPDMELGLIPWGVGNHGGGPSRQDIRAINAFKADKPGIIHSTPDRYFEALEKKSAFLPLVSESLMPFAVGCYTSQVRIKQRHRALESLIDETCRMAADAAVQGLMEYPYTELDEAARDLCMSEFHDILPGSSIQDVEESALMTLAHGAEILTKLRAKAFFALAAGEKRAEPGEFPVLVYNPHPCSVETEVSAEFMLADQNWKDEFTNITVWQNGEKLPAQVEKERSNLPLDWRKRVVFRAKLAPMQLSRFDCRTEVLPAKPVPVQDFTLDNGCLRAVIDPSSGLLTSYRIGGFEYLSAPACRLLAIQDSVDPWGMNVDRFRDVKGEFRLMTPEESARFAGTEAGTLPPVRVTEDGDVRKVIEACFIYESSCAMVTYSLPKKGSAADISVRLLLNEKDTMIKLSFPTVLCDECIGEGMFGSGPLFADGRENVSQQWLASAGGACMFAVMNRGCYGSDFEGGEVRLSLVRSAAYTAHPIFDRAILPQNRFSPRIDQGERMFDFRINAGERDALYPAITRQAQLFSLTPYALCFFPNGDGETHRPLIEAEGAAVTNAHLSADGKAIIVRIFNGSEKPSAARITAFGAAFRSLTLTPFEFRTLRIDTDTNAITEAGLCE